jgi:hypothetical protein
VRQNAGSGGAAGISGQGRVLGTGKAVSASGATTGLAGIPVGYLAIIGLLVYLFFTK